MHLNKSHSCRYAVVSSILTAQTTSPTIAGSRAEFPFTLLASVALMGTMAVSSFTAVVGPVVRTLGMQEWHSGLAMTASGVTWTLMARRWGRLSDRVGRRRVLLLGLGVSAALYFGLALFLHACLTYPPGVLLAVVGLVLFRAAIGSFHSALPPTVAAMIAANTTVGTRAAAMAKLGAANSAGMLIGPAVAGWLAADWLVLPLYVAALLPVIAWGLLWWRLPEMVTPQPAGGSGAVNPGADRQAPLAPEERRGERLGVRRRHCSDGSKHRGTEFTERDGAAAVVPRQPWLDPRLRLAGAVAWASMLSISVAQVTVGFYAIDRLGLSPEKGAALAGWALTAVGVGLLLAQTLVMRLRSVSSATWIGSGAAVASVGFALIAAATTYQWLLLAHVVAAIGMGMISPSLQALAADAVGPTELGKASGTIASLQGFGMLVGPLLGTVVYRFSPSAPYLTVGTIMLLIAVWVPYTKRGG